MRAVGIDIGSHQVKLVEVQTTSKGFQLVSAVTRNLSRATGTDLELEVIEFLRETCAKYDPATTRFCVALRQDRVSVRNKMFPFNDRSRIQKTLPFELEEDLPFSADNAVFDGKIIRFLGTTAEVLACATPKQHVAHLLQLMKDSNIDPFIVSAEGVAFANLFEHWSEPIPQFPAPPPVLDEEALEKPVRPIRVILNIGHTHTTVLALDGNTLIGLRSIVWGGRNLIEAIAQKYSLAPADAQKEMELKAFILTTRQEASYEAKIFSDLIAKGVRELVRDVQMSLLEFKAEFNATVTDIRMTGGVSGIQGLAPFLTQHLEVPVNRVPVLDLFSNVAFERTEQGQLRFGVATGLALEGLRKPRNPAVNFLKSEFARQSSFALDLWRDWGGFIRAGAVATLLLCLWAYGRGYVATTLEDISGELMRNQGKAVARLSTKNANEAGVKKFIRENRKKISEMRTLESLAKMNSAMDVLMKISSSMPDGKFVKVDISQLLINDANVVIEGSVRGGKDLVENVRKSLANAAADGQISLDSVQPATGKTSFKMSFKVDRNIEKVTK